MTTSPPWVSPRLQHAPPRPARKLHLDFHNSRHIPAIGDRFDAAQFAATLADAHVDTVVLFAKDMHGYFYYPTATGPTHPGLSGRDLLGEQVAACRARGIRVLVYYCVTWDNELAESRPEWLAFRRSRESYLPKFGEPPGWTALCLSNPDFIDLMLTHVEEIITRYRPDGVWFDMPMPNEDNECFCRNCLAAIRERGEDPLDLTAQRHQMQRLLMTWLERSSAFVESLSPGAIVEQNNQTRLGLQERSPLLHNVEVEALPTGGWGYGYFGVMARYCRGLEMSYTGMTGRFLKSWGDFGGLKSRQQLALEVAAIVATGAEVSLGDQLPPSGVLDPAVYETITPVYAELERLHPFLERAAGVAEAAIVVSGLQLADFARMETGADPSLVSGVLGASRLLIERRIQFDVVEAGTVPLSRYRLLALTEGSAFSGEQIAEIERFLQEGGRIISSAAPGTAQDSSWRRALGITSSEPSPFVPAYATTQLTGLSTFDFALYDGADRWTVEPRPEVETFATLAEPLFNRDGRRYTSHAQAPVAVRTDRPVFLADGACAEIAFPLAGGYHDHGYWAYSALFAAALDRIYSDQLLRVSGPTTLEASVTHQAAGPHHEERWIVHLVNFAGARRSSGDRLEFYDDLVPMRSVTVDLALAHRNYRAFVAESAIELPIAWEGDRATVEVPVVEIAARVVFQATDTSADARVQ
ncbi:alpha-L-fucosidase [Microbacterium sp. HJ5]